LLILDVIREFYRDPESAQLLQCAQADQIAGRLVNAYVQASQYSYAAAGFPLNTIINQTLALNDSLSIVGAAIDAMSMYYQGQCVPLYLPGSGPVYVRNPFDYIVCTYLPYPRRNYDRLESIFGGFPPDLSVRNINAARCEGMWASLPLMVAPDTSTRWALTSTRYGIRRGY
jgi:hypothetical protein